MPKMWSKTAYDKSNIVCLLATKFKRLFQVRCLTVKRFQVIEKLWFFQKQKMLLKQDRKCYISYDFSLALSKTLANASIFSSRIFRTFWNSSFCILHVNVFRKSQWTSKKKRISILGVHWTHLPQKLVYTM